ncbi:MAG: hypothetical protein FD153_1746 [Rhodospirillaceae bacterium]|nr:MAG: hypothetical protein FD153_1746 [Rhodospirillaceae bacterium]
MADDTNVSPSPGLSPDTRNVADFAAVPDDGEQAINFDLTHLHGGEDKLDEAEEKANTTDDTGSIGADTQFRSTTH